ncbi:MAG: hypothetical protein LBF60_04065 [Treponema sp.]|jgi:hypothetical protein|nr:hypothetical protein [Treponema sp.]
MPQTARDVQSQNAGKGNAEVFHENFSPYRGRHIYQKQEPAGLFGDPLSAWLTSGRPLTSAKIASAILGEAIIGYFLAVFPRSFCVDIDDHAGKGAGYLLSVYDAVCRKLARPSLLCKTPRGLHAFYFLTHPVPELLLIERAKAAVAGVPAEVKPTSQIGTRIPAERRLIDPLTWEPLNRPFADAVHAADKYHPVELFGMSVMPDTVVETLKSRKDRVVKVKVWEKIGRLEAEYAGETRGVRAGATNDILCELIPVYRGGGLTPEEAAAEFSALLDPSYTGELRSFRRLVRRVESFYKKGPETRFNAMPMQDPDLFTEIIAGTVVELVAGPTESRQQKAALTMRRRTVKKAVLLILGRKAYQTLPTMTMAEVSPANASDIRVAKETPPFVCNITVFADKAYGDKRRHEDLEKQGLRVHTPVKREKGQKYLSGADNLFSRLVSKARQAIELFFNRLNEKNLFNRPRRRVQQTVLLHLSLPGLP